MRSFIFKAETSYALWRGFPTEAAATDYPAVDPDTTGSEPTERRLWFQLVNSSARSISISCNLKSTDSIETLVNALDGLFEVQP